MKTCLLTFDIEEWFQVENLKAAIHRQAWNEKVSTVQENTQKILGILDRHGVKATFFILGWVADRYPELVLQIYRENHEIACHGFNHERANQINPINAFEDIKKSKRILENIISEKIYGYRAPNFSISDRILKHLEELNFLYDSSYNPFRLNTRYGSISGLSKINTTGCYLTQNNLYEIPLSSYLFCGVHFPMGGGAYFRLYPFWFFKQLLKRKLRQESIFNFYLHPWEFEPE